MLKVLLKMSMNCEDFLHQTENIIKKKLVNFDKLIKYCVLE